MDWKDWLERNAFFVVVGACVATGGTVAGFMEYYSGQRIEILKGQCDSEKADLKTQLASISRNLGHEEFLDVRKMVVPRDRVSPPPNSQYFDDAEFYAPQATGGWLYSKTSEVALVQNLAGVEVSKLPVLQKAGNLAPIHLWRTKKTLSVKGGGPFKSLFSYVYVEKFPIEALRSAVGSLAEEDEDKPHSTNPQAQGKAGLAGSDPFLDSMFRGDIAGKLLTFSLVAQVMGGLNVELLNVQKVHNVVYVAMRCTLKDVEVEKVAYPRYYIYSEFVIISDGANATMVKTFVPSPDPSGSADDAAYVSGWFNGLRVLVA